MIKKTRKLNKFEHAIGTAQHKEREQHQQNEQHTQLEQRE